MHLGNGAITTECALLTMGAAATGLAIAAVDLRRQAPSGSQLSLAAGLGGLVFAAQAINVTLLPGSSAHLVGGVLLAWTLGPSLGLWTMAIILALQASLMGDGGWMALGANIFNMGLLPAVLVTGYRRFVTSTDQAFLARYAGAGTLAAIAVPLAAAAIAVQTRLFRAPDELLGWSQFARQMLLVHFWIGIGEGALTALLAFAYDRLMKPTPATTGRQVWGRSIAMLTAGVLLVVVTLPLASSLPDGYEASAEIAGLEGLLAEDTSDLAALGGWTVAAAERQNRIVERIAGVLPNEQLLVICATLLTAGATLLVASGLTRVPVPVRR
jgi:cobalt/nickel transport system permease protein